MIRVLKGLGIFYVCAGSILVNAQGTTTCSPTDVKNIAQQFKGKSSDELNAAIRGYALHAHQLLNGVEPVSNADRQCVASVRSVVNALESLGSNSVNVKRYYLDDKGKALLTPEESKALAEVGAQVVDAHGAIVAAHGACDAKTTSKVLEGIKGVEAAFCRDMLTPVQASLVDKSVAIEEVQLQANVTQPVNKTIELPVPLTNDTTIPANVSIPVQLNTTSSSIDSESPTLLGSMMKHPQASVSVVAGTALLGAGIIVVVFAQELAKSKAGLFTARLWHNVVQKCRPALQKQQEAKALDDETISAGVPIADPMVVPVAVEATLSAS